MNQRRFLVVTGIQELPRIKIFFYLVVGNSLKEKRFRLLTTCLL